MKDLGHKLDEYINVWGRFAFLLPFALFTCLFVTGIPSVPTEYWLHAVSAGLFLAVSTVCLSKAFKLSDISIAIALWKISIIVLLFLGIVFLGEEVTIQGTTGVMVTLFGVYLLNIRKANISLWEPFLFLYKDEGLRYALFAGILLAPVYIFFKKTILISNDPYFPALTNMFFACVFTTPLIAKTSVAKFKAIPQHFTRFVLMGFFAYAATVFNNIALSLAVAAYVDAVKQVEVILGLLAGIVFFKERERVKEIWFGSLIIISGILILIFSK